MKAPENSYSATPIVHIGINPNDGDSAGIFVGLKDIKDTQGNLVADAKLAGYQIEVYFDHTQAKVLDIYDEAHLGNFTYNNGTSPNITSVVGEVYQGSGSFKTIVADVVYQGTSTFEKLFFVSFALTGSSSNPTNVVIKFTSLSDTNWNYIMIPDVTLTFQRGKIYNEALNKSLSIAYAVAGLQYLANLRNIGLNPGEVNVINMASILPPEAVTTGIKPSVKDVIALLQKIVGLRDDNFLLLGGGGGGGIYLKSSDATLSDLRVNGI